MSESPPLHAIDQHRASDPELLECLRKIGKGLISAGTSAGVVENTLSEIARMYESACEIVALPNMILIDLGGYDQGQVILTVQRLTSIQLDQVSEMGELVERVKNKEISLALASKQLDQIIAKKPRFNSALTVLRYVVSCISEIITRSPCRTTALVSQMLAFWFLVPGARGMLSVTQLLSNNFQSAVMGIGEMVILIIVIALGVLLGTLIISPHKYIPISEEVQKLQIRYAK